MRQISADQSRIPFVALYRQYNNLRDDFHAALDDVGSSGAYILGDKVSDFERQCENYLGVKHVVGVANGSDALFLALKAFDIGVGDEVITVANSFIATAWTIVATGATPVFVDVGDDLNIDAHQITERISPRTKAIMPVHLTGRPANMALVTSVAKAHGLRVIEDAAQAFGAIFGDKRAGAIGDAAGFSMHPLKNLGLYGDGGIISTNDSDIYKKLLLLRNHGLKNRDECQIWGYNSRLDSLQAAFGLVKIRHIEDWNRRSREIAALYRDSLKDYVQVPVDKPGEVSVYHNFVIRTPFRDDLASYLSGNGVETRIHYPVPIHQQVAFREKYGSSVSLPNTERYCKEILSLPIFPELTDREARRVIEAILGYFNDRK